ncbi:MAG TPA: hypothetical protein VFW40_14055, partial [Capsulimonadaceae bacterium]|nr:hypothetical protein [Capsulimonadaceae bacterium]
MPHCAGPRCHAIVFLLVAGFCLTAMGWNSPTFAAGSSGKANEKPLMRNFIGLNVHGGAFRPALYQPV